MRIAFVNWTSRAVGGAELYLSELMAALDSHGHELVLFCGSDDGKAAYISPARRRLADHRGAYSQIAAWKPDVVVDNGAGQILERQISRFVNYAAFVHSYQGLCISGTRLNRVPRPATCSVQFGAMCLVRYFPRRCGGLSPTTMLHDYRLQKERIERFRRAKKVLTLSNHVRGMLIRHGVRSNRVDSLPIAVPPPAKTIVPANNEPVRKLLFLGRLDRVKGVHVLLKTMGLLRQDNPGIELDIVGDGPERKNLEQQAQDMPVRFSGWLNGDDLESAFADAQLLVVPSLWPEPFGRIGPEALVRGMPVVAFDSGGVRDWLTHGENGVLADADPPTARSLAVAISEAVQPDTYQRLSIGAVRTSKGWTYDNHCMSLLAALSEVAG